MSKALKSILPIGGAVLGSMTPLGPVGGALIGGALGSAASGVGQTNANISEMAARGGFSSSLTTPAFTMTGDRLAKADLSIIRDLNTVPMHLGGVAQQTGALRGPLKGINPNFAGTAAGLAGLRADVRPGFGRLTEARVRSIRDAGAESMGNLRESLARRGVMGSSFANDAQSRQRMATGQEEERARAEAAVEEIGMSRQLIIDQIGNEVTRFGAELGLAQEERAILGQQAQVLGQRAAALADILNRELNELQIAGNIRAGFNSAVVAQATNAAQLQAYNAQQQAGNAGMGIMGAALSGGLFGGSLFGGGGAGPVVAPVTNFGRGGFGMLGAA